MYIYTYTYVTIGNKHIQLSIYVDPILRISPYIYIYIFINQQLDVFESMAAWHDDPNGLVNFFESNGLVSHFFWGWNY
jgi:hypothetical protein